MWILQEWEFFFLSLRITVITQTIDFIKYVLMALLPLLDPKASEPDMWLRNITPAGELLGITIFQKLDLLYLHIDLLINKYKFSSLKNLVSTW